MLICFREDGIQKCWQEWLNLGGGWSCCAGYMFLVGLCPPDRDLATRILFLFHRRRRLLVWKRQLGGEMVSSAALALGFLLARAERLERLLLQLLLGTWTMASFYCKTLHFRKYKNGWSVCAQYGMLRCLHWEKSVKLALNRLWQFTPPPFQKLRRQDGWERIGLSWVIAMTRMNNQGQWRLSCDQGWNLGIVLCVMRMLGFVYGVRLNTCGTLQLVREFNLMWCLL